MRTPNTEISVLTLVERGLNLSLLLQEWLLSLNTIQAILWNRIELSKIMNYRVISLDKAPQAYQEFDAGAPKKFIIDPHNYIAV